MGMMLVRVTKRNREPYVTVWNDEWRIAQAMEDFLTGAEWFEILGYYRDEDGERFPPLVYNFTEAEERFKTWGT